MGTGIAKNLNKERSNSFRRISRNKITFEYDIYNIEQINNQIVVSIWDLQSGDLSKQPENGIYAYDKNGGLILNVKDIIKEEDFCGRFSVSKVDGKFTIILDDVRGVHYTIDMENRAVINKVGFK